MVQVCACFFICIALASMSLGENTENRGDVLSLILDGKRLRSAGKWTDAERVLLSAQAKALSANASGAVVASIANELGWVYQDLGRLSEAERYYSKALRLIEQRGDSNRALAIVNNLASLYVETGQYSRVDRLNLAERVQGPVDPRQGLRAKSSLASVAMFRGNYAEAETLFRENLRSFEADQDYQEIAITLGNLGVVYLHSKRAPQAVEMLERCKSVLESHSLTGPVFVKSLANLSVAYADVGRRREAVEFAERAAHSSETLLGADSPVTATILFECASVMKQAGHKPEAKRMQKRADEILRAQSISDTRRLTVEASDLMPRNRQGR